MLKLEAGAPPGVVGKPVAGGQLPWYGFYDTMVFAHWAPVSGSVAAISVIILPTRPIGSQTVEFYHATDREGRAVAQRSLVL